MKLKEFVSKLFKRANGLDDFLSKQLEDVETTLLESARLNATIDPKVRSGDLWRSIRLEKKKRFRKLSITLTAGDNKAYYAPFLEHGTDDGRLYPRHFLKNAFDGTKKRVPEKLKKITKLFLDDLDAR